MHTKNLTQNSLKVAAQLENFEFSDKFSTKQLNPKALTPTDAIAQKFVALFPRRWQWIYKPDGYTGDWQTETRYELTPRDLWREHQSVFKAIGVRFDVETGYLVLDIDKDSRYHPQNNEHGLSLVKGAMESMGLCRCVIVRSSHSYGLHLYFPLPSKVNTFLLACAANYALEKTGLTIKKGTLETFPNVKGFDMQYNGLRLPLQPQSGSFLLDENLDPYSDSIEAFLVQWDTAAACQDMKKLMNALATAPRRKSVQTRPTNQKTLEGFAADNAARIAEGWTEKGQTQDVILHIAIKHYVFECIEDEHELGSAIANTARNTIGFDRYCGDNRRIDRFALGQARWIIKSEKFYPSRSRHSRPKTDGYQTTTEPREKQPSAIERIKLALEQIGDRTFGTVRDLISAIRAIAKCSPSTLYKKTIKPLWQHLTRCNAAYSNDYSDLETEKSTEQPENSKIEIAETITESAVTVTPLNELLRDEFLPSQKINDPVTSGTPAASILSLATSEPIQGNECSQAVSFELMVAIASTCPSSRLPESKISRMPKEPPRQNPSTLENIQAIVTADPSKAGVRLAMLRAKLFLPILKREERAQTESAIAWLEKFIECDGARAIADG